MNAAGHSFRGFGGNARVLGRVVTLRKRAAVPTVVLGFALVAQWVFVAVGASAFRKARAAVQRARRADGGSIAGWVGHRVVLGTTSISILMGYFRFDIACLGILAGVMCPTEVLSALFDG